MCSTNVLRDIQIHTQIPKSGGRWYEPDANRSQNVQTLRASLQTEQIKR